RPCKRCRRGVRASWRYLCPQWRVCCECRPDHGERRALRSTHQPGGLDRPLNGEIGDLLRPESELADHIAQAVHFAVFDAEVEHILTQPLPTLESYSLL